MNAFKWRQGASYPVKAQDAGEHLAQLEAVHGSVTAQMVLDDSRPDDALLHPCFTWDDFKAAEKCRRQEAKELIGNLVTVHVVEKADEAPKEVRIRAFSNVSNGKESATYMTTLVAMSDEEKRNTILENARREMQVFIHKWESLVDIKSMLEEELRKW